MASDLLSDSSAWFRLTPAQKQIVTDGDFKETYANDKDYLSATPERKAQYKTAFKQAMEEAALTSEHNPSVQRRLANQKQADTGGWLSNTITKIADSHVDATQRLGMIPDATIADGTVANNFADKAAKVFQTRSERGISAEQLRLAKTLIKAQTVIDKEGFWSVPGVKAALGTIPEIISNPVGVIHLGADSSSSATMMAGATIAGAKGGAALGTLAGPGGTAVGATIGSMFGMAVGEMTDATSNKLLETVEQELTKRGQLLTKENIQVLSQDKDFVKHAQTEVIKYSAGLTGADMLMSAGLSRWATAPARIAMRTARETVKQMDNTLLASAAKLQNVPLPAYTSSIINKEASAILAAQTFKANLGRKVIHYAGETASEGTSEVVGKAAIGEEATFTDIMNETLGGVGTAPITMAAGNIAFGSKLATDKVVAVGKEIINSTPETRAAKIERKAALDQISKLSETEAVHDYSNKIAVINPDSEDHNNLSDPVHPNYNPIAAMDAVTKLNDPTAHSKATAIANDYNKQVIQDLKAFEALQIKLTQEGYKPTVEETNELKHLHAIVQAKTPIVSKLWAKADAIQTSVTNKTTTTPEAIDALTDAPEAIVTKLGSHGANDKTLEIINTVLKRPEVDMDSGIKEQLTLTKDTILNRQKIEASQMKSSSEVSKDIYHGVRGSEFKGIDAYQKGIQYFLNPKVNNPAKAQVELDGLIKFSSVMQEKADVAEAVFKAGGIATPAQQAILDQHGLEIHHVKSKNLIPLIRQEADALKTEVKLAQMTYNRLSGQTNTTTSTPVQTAPTGAVTKPTVTSIPVTPIAKPITKTPVSSKPSNTTGFTLTTKTPFTAKDQKKASMANAFIGFGVQRTKGVSSTGQYAIDAAAQGIPINEAIKPDATTVAFVSVSGEGTHVTKTIEHARRVLDAGGTVVMDAAGSKPGQAGSPHNINGEGAVQKGIMKLVPGQKATYVRTTINDVTTFKQSVEQQSINPITAKAETVKPESVPAPQTASKPEAIVAPTPDAVVAPTDTQEAAVNNPVDVLADYDIAMAALEITYTNAEGETVTKSYAEAIAENKKRTDEAQAVLDCIGTK